MTLELRQINKFKNNLISISLDEGEMVGKTKILSVTDYVLDFGLVKTPFLIGLCELNKFDTETISQETLKIMKSREIKND